MMKGTMISTCCFLLLLCLLVFVDSTKETETTKNPTWLQGIRQQQRLSQLMMTAGTGKHVLKGRKKGAWGSPGSSTTSYVPFLELNNRHLMSAIQNTRGGTGWGGNDGGSSWGDDGNDRSGANENDDFSRRFGYDEDDFMDDIADCFDDDDDDENRPYIMSHEIELPAEGEFITYAEVNSDEIQVRQYIYDKIEEWNGKYQNGLDLLENCENCISTKKTSKQKAYASSALVCFQQAKDVILNDTIMHEILIESESEDISEDTFAQRCQLFLTDFYLSTRLREALCYYYLHRVDMCLEIIDGDILPRIENLIVANSSISNTTNLIITRNDAKGLRNEAIYQNLTNVHSQKALSHYNKKEFKKCMGECSKILDTTIPFAKSQLMGLEKDVDIGDTCYDEDGTLLPVYEKLANLTRAIKCLKCASKVGYITCYYNQHVVKNFNTKQYTRCMKACKKIMSMKLKLPSTKNSPDSTQSKYDDDWIDGALKRIRFDFEDLQSRAKKMHDYLQTRMDMKDQELEFREKFFPVVLPVTMLLLIVLKLLECLRK